MLETFCGKNYAYELLEHYIVSDHASVHIVLVIPMNTLRAVICKTYFFHTEILINRPYILAKI